MTATEQAILTALLDLDAAAAALRAGPGAGGPKPDVAGILGRLAQLARELPADAPGDLRHYLQRQSYEKARLFLLGRDAENAAGSCGH